MRKFRVRDKVMSVSDSNEGLHIFIGEVRDVYEFIEQYKVNWTHLIDVNIDTKKSSMQEVDIDVEAREEDIAFWSLSKQDDIIENYINGKKFEGKYKIGSKVMKIIKGDNSIFLTIGEVEVYSPTNNHYKVKFFEQVDFHKSTGEYEYKELDNSTIVKEDMVEAWSMEKQNELFEKFEGSYVSDRLKQEQLNQLMFQAYLMKDEEWMNELKSKMEKETN